LERALLKHGASRWKRVHRATQDLLAAIAL
jgi:hypothetical protein